MRILIALFVVLMHASPIIWMILPHEEEKQKRPPGETTVDLISGDVELQSKEEQTRDPNALHIACPKTYEGIGIKRAWGGRVTEVAKGWPADRAGIKIGDTIEPWLFYPVDGFMEFEVVRGHKRAKMRLKTEQICFRDGPF